MRSWPSARSQTSRHSSAWSCSRSRPMLDRLLYWSHVLVALAIVGVLGAPLPGATHPLGNFSINHYTAIHLESDAVVLHYIIDMAEIPTFQEIQDTQLVPQD